MERKEKELPYQALERNNQVNPIVMISFLLSVLYFVSKRTPIIIESKTKVSVVIP